MEKNNKLSILSETNPIQCWLDTPMGYYVGSNNWGNNLHTILFKNREYIKLNLNIILDKIREDLGDEIVNQIDEISAYSDKDDNIVIVIVWNNQVAYQVVSK